MGTNSLYGGGDRQARGRVWGNGQQFRLEVWEARTLCVFHGSVRSERTLFIKYRLVLPSGGRGQRQGSCYEKLHVVSGARTRGAARERPTVPFQGAEEAGPRLMKSRARRPGSPPGFPVQTRPAGTGRGAGGDPGHSQVCSGRRGDRPSGPPAGTRARGQGLGASALDICHRSQP